MSTQSDRNLLLGVLAWQLDFIDRGMLVDGMHAWVLNKASSLGSILVDKRQLSIDEHRLLEKLVDQHLQRHAGDIKDSLATVSVVASMRGVSRQLLSLTDPDLTTSLFCAIDDTPPMPSPAVPDGNDPETQRTISCSEETRGSLQRFQILSHHASGGLGDVYLARDLELNRNVALKEMQPRVAHDPLGRNRFNLEAEVTGSLEHPGIVPVYSHGCYADQRPFYAMRFIRGKTLREAIADYHQGNGHTVGKDTLALRKLLGHFTDICNAVAFAHSRGVLHRDLKPANVMLGRYGETLVLDWGLAKIVERGEEQLSSGEDTLKPRAAGDSSETMAGTAVGTPSYMSPEQASGQINELGPATDVYSLGAVLYTILTGKTPFSGNDAAGILQAVKEGKFSPPRAVLNSVPPPLEAVCLKAMARKAGDRYASPLHLAEDIEHWLADEPVSVYREPFKARTRRWLKRHQTFVGSSAAATLIGIVSLIALVALAAANNRTLDAANTRLTIANGQLREANESERTARNEEAAARRQAQQNGEAAEMNFELARGALDDVTMLLKTSAALDSREMRPVKAKLSEIVLQYYQSFLDQRGGDSRLASQSALATMFIADTEANRRNRSMALTNYQRALETFRDMLSKDTSLVHERLCAFQCFQEMAFLLHESGQATAAESHYRSALEQAEELLKAAPDDLTYQDAVASANRGLGLVHMSSGQMTAADKHFEAAMSIYRQWDSQSLYYAHRAAPTLQSLSQVLNYVGRQNDADAALREARQLYRRLLDSDPRNEYHQFHLAALGADFGRLLYYRGQYDEAESMMRESLQLGRSLVTAFPNIVDYENLVATVQVNAAKLYRDTDRFEDAEAAYTESAAILESYARNDPDALYFAAGVARTMEGRGQLAKLRGDFDSSLAWYDRALAEIESLLARAPDYLSANRYLAYTLAGRAETLKQLGREPEAQRDWQRLIDMVAGLQSYEIQLHRAEALAHLGRHQQASQLAEEQVRNMDSGQTLLLAARVLATCYATVSDETLATTYAQDAVRLLNRARDAGFFNSPGVVRQLDSDPIFERLRQCAPYREEFRDTLVTPDSTGGQRGV